MVGGQESRDNHRQEPSFIMEVNNGDGVGNSNMSRKVIDEEKSTVVIPETAHQISSGLFPFLLA